MKNAMVLMVLLLGLGLSPAEGFANFTYNPAGQLVPGSGQGRVDEVVYKPGMRFPLEAGPAYANSQVWGRGGMNGGGGSQCDTSNYSYPWWDNFCETRQWSMPFCPAGSGHQGQDIRPATCVANTHWAVAADAGRIIHISSYLLYMIADDGTVYTYLHMDPASIGVAVDQRVSRGQRLGRVSNYFGGTPTTIHLHFEILRYFEDLEWVHIPLYTSLVQSYRVLIGEIADPGPVEPDPVDPVDPVDPGPEPLPRCDVPPADGIIDDGNPCFLLHGNTETWRRAGSSSAIADGYYWTFATDEAEPDGWAQWRLNLAEAGQYKVEALVVTPHNKSVQAPYEIRHGGQLSRVAINQFAAPGWRELGVFEFAAGEDQWVALYDNTGEAYSERVELMADAIRVTRVGEATNPGPDPAPTPDPNPQDPAPQDPTPPSDPHDPTPAPDPTPGQNPGDDEPVIELLDEGQNSSGSGCRVAPTPDPGSTALIFLGLLAMFYARRRASR